MDVWIGKVCGRDGVGRKLQRGARDGKKEGREWTKRVGGGRKRVVEGSDSTTTVDGDDANEGEDLAALPVTFENAISATKVTLRGASAPRIDPETLQQQASLFLPSDVAAPAKLCKGKGG